MRKFLISVAAVASAIGFAVPASAQYYDAPPAHGYGDDDRGYDGYGDYGRDYGRDRYGRYGESRRLIAANRERMARIHSEIETAAAQGRLSPGEAARLHRRASQFDRELQWLARDGMTGQEGATFDARADRLAQEVRARTGHGYGYGYDRYDRW